MSIHDNWDNWDAALLRLTAFVAEPDYDAALHWWDNVVGDAPEERTAHSKPTVHEYSGEFEGNNLKLIVQSVRVDWIFSGTDTIESFQPLGPFESQIAVFLDLMDKWFELVDCPPMSRLALGIILRQPVDGPLAGYNLLKTKYIPFDFRFDENTSDFMYQVNRRRQSQIIEEMELNRLMKWSVRSRTSFILGPVPRQLPPTYSAQLELDINSSTDYEDNILPVHARSLLNEFVGLGEEIMKKGDRV